MCADEHIPIKMDRCRRYLLACGSVDRAKLTAANAGTVRQSEAGLEILAGVERLTLK
jgi:hypothetical protein